MSSSSSDHHQQLPSLGESWRRLQSALSFSSVRVRGDTGTHLLHVGRYYSRVDGKLVPGDCIESPAFRAGGRKWKLFYYPNGADASRRGRACAQLMLMRKFKLFPDASCLQATAEYRVSILGRDGEPAHSCAVGSREYLALAGWKTSEVDVLSTAKEQSAALGLVQDDGLVVRCDVTVLNVQEESRIRWYLRKLWNGPKFN